MMHFLFKEQWAESIFELRNSVDGYDVVTCEE